MEAAERYGLRAQEFLVFDDMFRVNLFCDLSLVVNHQTDEETSEKHRRRFERYAAEHSMLLSKEPRLSAAKIAEEIGISSRNVESNIKKLKEKGILIRCGAPKGGYWEITEV